MNLRSQSIRRASVRFHYTPKPPKSTDFGPLDTSISKIQISKSGPTCAPSDPKPSSPARFAIRPNVVTVDPDPAISDPIF